jgi:hypothetical protein
MLASPKIVTVRFFRSRRAPRRPRRPGKASGGSSLTRVVRRSHCSPSAPRTSRYSAVARGCCSATSITARMAPRGPRSSCEASAVKRATWVWQATSRLSRVVDGAGQLVELVPGADAGPSGRGVQVAAERKTMPRWPVFWTVGRHLASRHASHSNLLRSTGRRWFSSQNR